MMTSTSTINAWGNGLAVRLTKPQAKAAGAAEGSKVRVHVEPSRVVIEAETRPTLEQMLAAFDTDKHGGALVAASGDCVSKSVVPVSSLR